MLKSLNLILCVCLLVVTIVSLASGVQAQTQQASCTFHTFSLTQNPQMITVTGVNDYGTVVGYADFGEGASRQEKAFVHYSGGGTTYWLPSGAKSSAFGGRNDAGVTTGAYSDSSNHTHAFLLKGSTLTPIVRPYGAGPAGINKYNSVVGTYVDANGNEHGFKRYSDGTVIHLTYPGALGDACLRDQRYQHNRRLLQRHRQRRARLHLQERPVGIAAVPKCDTIHRAIWDQQLQRDRGTRAGTRLHVQRWYVQRNRGTGFSRDSSQGHRSRWTDRRHGGPDSWFLGVLPLTNLSDQNHRFVVLL
jgi:hypothetical protein